MASMLTIPVTDAAMARLQEWAAARGTTPEEVAAAEVEKSIACPRLGDDLRMWAGSADSGLTDVAQRHHEYLGQAIMDELRGRSDDDSVR